MISCFRLLWKMYRLKKVEKEVNWLKNQLKFVFTTLYSGFKGYIKISRSILINRFCFPRKILRPLLFSSLSPLLVGEGGYYIVEVV
jgi:hypothetical protein